MSSAQSAVYYASAHWRSLRDVCRERAAGMCEVEGCRCVGSIADHIDARPDLPYPTPFDTLDNLRWLCASHDSQVKEQCQNDSFSRRNGGRFRINGCDEAGWPLDPKRH